MKNKIIILLFAILFVACTKEEKQLSINGIISNYSKDYALFRYDTTGFGLTNSVDTIKIDDNGIFEFKTDLLKVKASLVFEDTKRIRLTIPSTLNKPINIELDFSKPDSIKIRGEQAAFIQFYIDQQKYWMEIYQDMSNKHPELESGDNQSRKYHIIQDTITRLRIQYLYKYFEDLNLAGKEDKITDERNSLLYSNLYYRMSGQKNKIIEQLAFYQKSNLDSTNFLTYSNEVVFSDISLFVNDYYREFVNDFIMKAVRVENPQGDFSSFEFYLDKGLNVIDKWFQTSQTNVLQKLVFINHLISAAIIFKEFVIIKDFQVAIEALRKNEYASIYLQPIEDNLQKLHDSMSKALIGTKAPDFELKDINGKVHKLSDFGNKLVFIDVWASWCKPCISSLPKWNNLAEKYSENNDFQFLSVSIDDDINKWIKGVDKFKPKGINLFSGGKGFDSPFAKSFEINGIPTYFSIDKQGNIMAISSSVSEVQEIANEY